MTTTRDLQARIAMIDDAIADGSPEADRLRQMRAQYLAKLPETRTADASDDVVDEFTGRRGGTPASNQFGTFAVHTASDKQVAFIRRLVQTKDATGRNIKIPAELDTISKKSATALIDRLMGCPDKPVQTDGRPPCRAGISDKQLSFLSKLLGEKDTTGIDVPAQPQTLSVREASALIDALLARPRKAVQAPQPQAEIAAGAYLVDGRVIRVYVGQQSRRMLAQELVDATARTREEAWSYLGMASRFVPADAHRMTVQECEAASAGTEDHGWCCVCGARLDDPNSVKRGIGPVCRAKQGGI